MRSIYFVVMLLNGMSLYADIQSNVYNATMVESKEPKIIAQETISSLGWNEVFMGGFIIHSLYVTGKIRKMQRVIDSLCTVDKDIEDLRDLILDVNKYSAHVKNQLGEKFSNVD